MPNILIIEDDAAFCQMLQRFLTKRGYNVETSFNAPEAKSKFNETNYDLVLTDLRLPDYDGIRLLGDIKAVNPNTQVILMTGYAEVGSAVDAMKKGAFDYIAKPFTPDDIVELIEKAIAIPSGSTTVRVEKPSEGAIESQQKTVSVGKTVTGVSEASRKLDEYIKLVAPTDMSVLITGESGVGKEVFSKIIHSLSPRKHGKFIAVNCGAIPEGTKPKIKFNDYDWTLLLDNYVSV